MSETAWFVVMAPDSEVQWNISKWTYWNGSTWVHDNRHAYVFKRQSDADACAFQMTINDHSLMGKIHVWRFEQPVSEFAGYRPWRRVE